MAKKVNIRSNRTAATSQRNGSTVSADRDFKMIVKDIITSPAVKYVAGGIATAFLSRLATNLSDRYPEISNFIKENLESVEGRLDEFKQSLSGDSARH